jgi:hypothetical protein
MKVRLQIVFSIAEPKDCPNGATVSDLKYCEFVIKYPSGAIPPADSRLEDDIPRQHEDDPPIRSIALIIDVNHYPNLPDPDLISVRNDLSNLIGFLNRQDFDEIIVLENEKATKSNIDYFLQEYLPTELAIYGSRSRLLFAFSGHGDAPGGTGQSTQPGSLVLSGYRNSTDLSQLYPLANLTPQLILRANRIISSRCLDRAIRGDITTCHRSQQHLVLLHGSWRSRHVGDDRERACFCSWGKTKVRFFSTI